MNCQDAKLLSPNCRLVMTDVQSPNAYVGDEANTSNVAGIRTSGSLPCCTTYEQDLYPIAALS
jgi:hypothetical protein